MRNIAILCDKIKFEITAVKIFDSAVSLRIRSRKFRFSVGISPQNRSHIQKY